MTVICSPSRRWPRVLIALTVALGGLLAGPSATPAATAAEAYRPFEPGDPLPSPSPLPPSLKGRGAGGVRCAAGPDSPPPEASAAPLPPLDLLAHSRWLRLPVLMYHYVEPPAPGLSLVERGLTLRPEDFAAQMAYLHGRGYVTVSLYDLVAALRTGAPLPPRAVVLTFDGGHRALLRYALPVMQAYGFTGTIFAITKGMDDGQDLYLTWDQARDLYQQGWKIEPHTRTHIQLAGRSDGVQWSELCGSMLDVADHLGVWPRFIAYPSGLYDAQTLQLVKRLGFWGGLTTRIDRWHSLGDEYRLARVRVSATATLQQFMTSVDGDI